MSEFWTGLPNHVREVVLHTIYLLISLLIIRLFKMIFLVIKRWAYQSKLRRNGPDFKKASEYIRENKKRLNPIQRFLLAHTGEVYSTKSIVIYLLCILIGSIVFAIALELGLDELISLINYKVRAVFLICIALLFLVGFLALFPELKKYGRLYVLITLAIAILYAFMGINVFLQNG